MRSPHSERVAKTIREKIHAAWERSGFSQAELIRLSGLPFTQPQMSRRLSGDTPMSTAEAEAIARVLKVRIRVKAATGRAA